MPIDTYPETSTIKGGRLADIAPAQRPGALKGAQILAQCLKLEGVDVVFGYPGGANLEVFDVVRDFDIRCIRVEPALFECPLEVTTQMPG